MNRRTLPSLAAVVVLSISAAACGGDDDASAPAPTDDGVTTTSTTSTSTTSTTAATPGPTSVAPEVTAPPATDPDDEITPVLVSLDEIVGWLNGEPVSEQEYTERFADSFVAEIPYGEFHVVLDELASQAPWALDDDDVPEPLDHGDVVSVGITDGSGDRFVLHVGLAELGDGIELLFIEARFEPPETPGEALQQLSEFGTLRFVEAEIDGDECSAVIEVDPDDPMPLGSMFKLYVLGALVDAVDAGEIGWDTLVTVRDELRSIPAGVTQDEPTGTELTVEELAIRMISISDNTATDLLIDLLGRDAVEAALADYGHGDPGVTLPLLTTRELTILKFGDADLAARYVAATTAERREILDVEVAAAELPSLDEITPVGAATAESIEWFASPLDVCRAFVGLARFDEALDILSINPGVPATDDRWTYIGFKGGSSPGVLAVGWLVEDDRGDRYVVAGGVSNTDGLIPDDAAIHALALLRDTAAP